MKINKEKIFLSALLILQVFFIGYYLITKNNTNNLSSYSSIKDVKSVHNDFTSTSNNDNDSDTPTTNEDNITKNIYDTIPSNPHESQPTPTNTPSSEIDISDDGAKIETNNVNLSKISTNDYISNLSTIEYTISSGETISSLLRKYENTCNYKTGIKYLKSLNPNINLDNMDVNSKIKIPNDTFTLGQLHLVKSGDTWYKLITNNYPNYDVDTFTNFLVYINDLPNSDLPLGEKVFLPKL